MIADPVPNLMSRPYRGLSVQEVSFELTQTALLRWITGRNVYRRTAFVLVRNGSAGALIALGSRAGTELFGPVTQARVLALPAEVAMVDSPATDVGNASAMAEVAGRHRSPGVKAYVVTGRYRHVNFIWRPQPVTVFVDEVVPPHPAKLVDMARQAVAFDEDLPPVALVQRLISIPQLARSGPGGSCLLPCQGAAGASAGEPGQFLDRGPAYQPGWTLIGCRRSEQMRANVDDRGGVAMSERGVGLLERQVGRPAAYAAVRQAAAATLAGRFAHLGDTLAETGATPGLDLGQLRDPRTAVARAEALVRAWNQARNLRDI